MKKNLLDMMLIRGIGLWQVTSISSWETPSELGAKLVQIHVHIECIWDVSKHLLKCVVLSLRQTSRLDKPKWILRSFIIDWFMVHKRYHSSVRAQSLLSKVWSSQSEPVLLFSGNRASCRELSTVRQIYVASSSIFCVLRLMSWSLECVR